MKVMDAKDLPVSRTRLIRITTHESLGVLLIRNLFSTSFSAGAGKDLFA